MKVYDSHIEIAFDYDNHYRQPNPFQLDANDLRERLGRYSICRTPGMYQERKVLEFSR